MQMLVDRNNSICKEIRCYLILFQTAIKHLSLSTCWPNLKIREEKIAPATWSSVSWGGDLNLVFYLLLHSAETYIHQQLCSAVTHKKNAGIKVYGIILKKHLILPAENRGKIRGERLCHHQWCFKSIFCTDRKNEGHPRKRKKICIMVFG